jgi:hypothetical protein
MRRDDGQEPMFTSVTYFVSTDAVRAFARTAYEQAVVADAARQALSRWNDRGTHHNVVIDLQ